MKSKPKNVARLKQYVDRALAAKKSPDWCFEVAVEHGQILDNVKHMKWFHAAAAQHLIDEVGRWNGFSNPYK